MAFSGGRFEHEKDNCPKSKSYAAAASPRNDVTSEYLIDENDALRASDGNAAVDKSPPGKQDTHYLNADVADCNLEGQVRAHDADDGPPTSVPGNLDYLTSAVSGSQRIGMFCPLDSPAQTSGLYMQYATSVLKERSRHQLGIGICFL